MADGASDGSTPHITAQIRQITESLRHLLISSQPRGVSMQKLNEHIEAEVQRIRPGIGLFGKRDEDTDYHAAVFAFYNPPADDEDVEMEDQSLEILKPEDIGEEFKHQSISIDPATYDEELDEGEIMGDYDATEKRPPPAGVEVNGKWYPWKHYFGPEWKAKIRDLYAVSPMEVPEGMVAKPHDWQLKAAAQAHFCCEGVFRGFLCGDPPGLGKTFIGVLAMWRVKDEPGFSMVVCPASVRTQWRDTIENAFDANHAMRVLILDDPTITARDLINGEWDVVVCSYEFLQHQYTALAKTEADVASFVKGNHRGAKPVKRTAALHSGIYSHNELPIKRVILDEGQRINKFDSKRRAAVTALFCRAYIVLSGTLAHNKWHDIGALAALLEGHPFQDERSFLGTFAHAYEMEHRYAIDAKRLSILQRFLQAFTVIRPASLLTDLPGLQRASAPFKLLDREKAQVREAMDMYRKFIASQKKRQTHAMSKGFSLLARAKAASLHPLIEEDHNERHPINEAEDEAFDPDEGDPDAGYEDEEDEEDEAFMTPLDADEDQDPATRARWLQRVAEREELIKESGRLNYSLCLFACLQNIYKGEKIIVFSESLKWLDVLAEGIKRTSQIECLRFDGTVTTEEERQKVREGFERCDWRTPLLITAGAGCVGLNITAASIVVQTEVWWNENNEFQAICRAWRQHQKVEVKAMRLEDQSSAYDRAVLKAQKKKRADISSMMKPLVREHTADADFQPLL